MRRMLARLRARPLLWGVGAALAGAGYCAAAEPDAKPWYGRLMGTADKPDAAPPPRLAVSGPLDPNTLVEVIRAEQAAWDRRLEVCHKLREIAAAANDDSLTRQADALEQQATQLYHQRTARFGVKRGRTPAPTVELPPVTDAAPAFKVVTP